MRYFLYIFSNLKYISPIQIQHLAGNLAYLMKFSDLPYFVYCTYLFYTWKVEYLVLVFSNSFKMSAQFRYFLTI